jgi:hypothetical protein
LLVGEWPHLFALQVDNADRPSFPQERDAEHGAPAADLRPPKVYSGSASTSTI